MVLDFQERTLKEASSFGENQLYVVMALEEVNKIGRFTFKEDLTLNNFRMSNA